MITTGIALTLLVGRMVPTPAPLSLASALRRATVRLADDGSSGFELQFQVSKSTVPLEYDLLSSQYLAAFNRVALVVTMSSLPRVIMDGLITRRELHPGSGGQPDMLFVHGRDLSIAMSLKERTMSYPGLNDSAIVEMILLEYAEYGILGEVLPTSISISDLPIEVVAQQVWTDLAYVKWLARRNGYVFQITPGMVPLMNTAYFGPPKRLGVPQHALTVNLMPGSNVSSLQFEYVPTRPTLIRGKVQDTLETDADIPIATLFSTRMPPLATEPALIVDGTYLRTSLIAAPGMDPIQALAEAQGMTDLSTDRVLVGRGEYDVLRNQDLLSVQGLVGVRGAGYSHDGLYYVAELTHVITPSSYKQQFLITREGLGSTTPVVRP
jgi:hypothetical protein